MGKRICRCGGQGNLKVRDKQQHWTIRRAKKQAEHVFLFFFVLINATPFSLTQSIFFGLPWPYGILCGRSTHPHWCQTPTADKLHNVCIKYQRHRETDTNSCFYQLKQTHHQPTSKHHQQTEEKSNTGDLNQKTNWKNLQPRFPIIERKKKITANAYPVSHYQDSHLLRA